MKRNILLTIEYDGTGFCGWQRQPNVRTVQGEVEAALSRICGTDIVIHGVSRTDAGVHALGQRASFSGDFGIPTDRIARVLNNSFSTRMKGGDIRILKAEEMPEGFHARYDAKGKKYRYVIYNSREIPVFLRDRVYHVESPLDVEAMKKAASYIPGKKDFACFQAAGGQPGDTTVRTVHDLTITQTDREDSSMISIEISGDGFLYNMVRIIAGTLVEAGLGKFPPEHMQEILSSNDRSRAGHTAPPQGLYLMEVYY